MDLLALSDFTLVARHGGFGKAARAADRPKATLSRRVAELEAQLEVRLFERGSHTLKLTQEGAALFARTEALLTDLQEATGSITAAGETPRGRLRVSAPLLFSQMAMGTLAARFVQQYPEVALEITTEDRPVDMVEEGYDLVIRVNPDPDARLVGRVLVRDRLVAVSSPGVRLPGPGGNLPAVVRAGSPTQAWTLRTAEGECQREIAPVLRLASLVMIRDAVRAGAGAALLPYSLVAGDVEAGTLVCWGDAVAPPIEIWALYPSRRLLSTRVSALLGCLKQAFPEGTPEELARVSEFGGR